MQKFGLKSSQSRQHSELEIAIIREQASALGHAGKKLRLALEAYQEMLEGSCNQYQVDLLLDKISIAAWALVLQREFLGFIEGNMEWIQKHYHIPQGALNRLGQSPAISTKSG